MRSQLLRCLLPSLYPLLSYLVCHTTPRPLTITLSLQLLVPWFSYPKQFRIDFFLLHISTLGKNKKKQRWL